MTAIEVVRKYEPRKCLRCESPINDICNCPDCSGKSFPTDYCHICLALYRNIVGRQYWVEIQNRWKEEQKDRRGRMGL